MEEEVITEASDSNSSNNTISRKRARPSNLVSGKFKGVVPQQNGHWGAQIYAKHQRIWLGTFKSEREAAMAYDSAAIKLRSGDSYRNFPWTNITLEEPDFQARYSTEAVLNMIKDGSYQSKFADFVRTRSQSAEEEVDTSLVKARTDGGLFCRQLFQKELTPSDVGKLNRLVIPKKYAVKYFPHISESAEENVEGGSVDDVQLVFYDKLMRSWKFRYCYWRSSQSFVFTRGWNRFVKEKELKANDTVTFFLCEPRGVKQRQTFCMIDVDRGQNNVVGSTEGANQDVGMHLELQLALRPNAVHDEGSKNLEEEEEVVEVEPLELQLALRPIVVHDEGLKNLKEEEEVIEVEPSQLQLELRPVVLHDEGSKNLEEEEEVVEVEPSELQLALRSRVLHGKGFKNLREEVVVKVESTDNNVRMQLELQLALRPSVFCGEAVKNLEGEEEVEPKGTHAAEKGFKLFGVRIKRRCCREGSETL